MVDTWEKSVSFVNSATGWDDVQLKFADVASTNGAIPADVAIAAFGGRALVEIGIRKTIQAARRSTPRHAQRFIRRMNLPHYRGMGYASLELLNDKLRQLPIRAERSPINGAAPVHRESNARGRLQKAST